MKYIMSIGVVVTLSVLAAASAHAQATAHIEFIDTGTPKNGDVVMTGWHGVIVRVVLDSGGPITRINLGNLGPGASISGAIAQRWSDPNGEGNYTQTSPGPLTANNSFGSDFNFDSHVLGPPEMYAASSMFSEGSVGRSVTQRTGLASDGLVEYVASPYIPQDTDPIEFRVGVRLGGLLDINPAFQADSIDAAYVVTDSGFLAAIEVSGDAGTFGAGKVFALPEPGAIGVSLVGIVLGLLRRRSGVRRDHRGITIETLESRVQFTVPSPTGVGAVLESHGSAVITWDDMGAGLSYSVERSTDGTNDWAIVTPSLLAPGTNEYTNPRLDASRAYYRVSATDGVDVATSSAVQETIPSGVTAPTFEVEAEALSGGGVRLEWELNPSGTSNLYIYRKSITDTTWPVSAMATLSVTNPLGHYDDTNVNVGEAYEYRLDFAGSEKYIYAGNAKAVEHSSGVALLVIDESLIDSVGTSLQSDIGSFAKDLIGEGYQVVTRLATRVDMPQGAPPDTSSATLASFYGPWNGAVQATKNTIRAVWDTYGTQLRDVILIGHVPVPYSGILPADGHYEGHGDHQGAWATDIYYATLSAADDIWTDNLTEPNSVYPVNANYPGDGKFDQNASPALADVAIGRIDLARTGWGVSFAVGDQPSDTEVAGLQAYFLKNHQYRTGQWTVKQQALTDRYIGPTFGEHYDRTRLSSNVGMANVKNGTVSTPNAATDLSDHDLNNDTWLWTYAAGPGSRYAPAPNYTMDYIAFDPVSYSRGLYANQYILPDFGKHQSVFNLFFGSFIGDWDGQNSLLRTPLGEADGYGLAVGWGGFPTWDIHQMGLGGTIGQSLLVTQNDRTTYTSDDGGNGSVDTSLMGDPTLRQDVIQPVSNVAAVSDPGGNIVTWQASPDSGVDGYYVYRATDPNGPWTRLNAGATSASATSYTDTSATDASPYYYMIRAEKLEVTPSGSYYNLSVGQIAGSAAPVLSSKEFNWQGHVPTVANPWKQWIDLEFSQSVLLAPAQLALAGQIWDSATSTLISKTLVYNTDFKLIDDPAQNTSRIVFLDPLNPGEAGFAPNGIWTLTVSGATSNLSGATLGSDQTLAFTFLIADATNDATVDFDDLVVLAQNYNQMTPDPDQPRVWGDFNCDGSVDFLDLTLLAQLYNMTLTPP